MAEPKKSTKLSYNCSLTKAHPKLCKYVGDPGCCIPLSELLKAEHYKGKCTYTEKVFALDKIETHLASREKRLERATVDCCFAIGSKEGTSPKLIFVECKLDLKNHRNAPDECRELSEKAKGSQSICGLEYPIHDKCYILFPDNIYQQARSSISRRANADSRLKNIEVMTVPRLYEHFFANAT